MYTEKRRRERRGKGKKAGESGECRRGNKIRIEWKRGELEKREKERRKEKREERNEE